MNSSSNCACGQPLFAALSKTSGRRFSDNARLNKDDCFDENEVMFLVAENPMLHLHLGLSNKPAVENLIYKVARDPSELRAHVQRIALLIRMRDQTDLYGALIDLFIALGANGVSIRKRMLTEAKPLLTERQFSLLDRVLERGIRSTDVLTDSRTTVLSKGYIGKNNFIVETSHSRWQQSCTMQSGASQTDPIQEANDCLEYGQINEARKILEQAVLNQPWREDLQSDLLEIYWATRDLAGCQAMYERLSDKFIPTHHAWIQTVERINAALRGV